MCVHACLYVCVFVALCKIIIPPNILYVLHVHVCLRFYQQQQQHHICMVTHTRYMQGCPQVFVLQVDIQASLNQKFRRKHIVMASALQNARIFLLTVCRNVYFLKYC